MENPISVGHNILFFKQDSPESQYVIKEIMKRGLRDNFVLINSDRYRDKIPTFVNTIPYVLDAFKNHIPLIRLSAFLRKMEESKTGNLIPSTGGDNMSPMAPLVQPPSYEAGRVGGDTEGPLNNPSETIITPGISLVDIDQPTGAMSGGELDKKDGGYMNPFQSSAPAFSHSHSPSLSSSMPTNSLRKPRSYDSDQVPPSKNNAPFPFTQKIERSSRNISEDDIKRMVAKREQDILDIQNQNQRQQWNYQM
jgi:hypothetical protein